MFATSYFQKIACFSALLLACSALAEASVDSPDTGLSDNSQNPSLSVVGKGTFKALFWKIYEAELLAPDGIYSPDADFALRLSYARDLKGQGIVDKSIELIAAQGITDQEKLGSWSAKLAELIPDIKKDDQLTGVKQDSGVEFYINQRYLGSFADREFSTYFFNIWLAETTSAPKLRKALLGG